MTQITAALVKELREKTGAGMMDCKKALTETAGDMEAAVDWLRTKGLAEAAKKAGRVAAEGLVGVAVAGTTGAVGRGQFRDRLRRPQREFQDFVRDVRRAGARAPAATSRRWRPRAYPGGGKTVADEADRRCRHHRREHERCAAPPRCRSSDGVVASYVHNAAAPGLGKIGVLVGARSRPAMRRRCKLRHAGRHACRRRQPAGAHRGRSRSGGGRARARASCRTGARQRQARQDHRQDGRGPPAQVLRGSRCCSRRPS